MHAEWEFVNYYHHCSSWPFHSYISGQSDFAVVEMGHRLQPSPLDPAEMSYVPSLVERVKEIQRWNGAE